tara:strand:+ start:487 stop:1287 length:801 start_codon:yes stop_codon:yes gene_type:complete
MSESLASSSLRSAARLMLMALWVVLMILPVTLVWALRAERLRSPLVRRFFSGLTTILSIRCTWNGAPVPERPLMLVTNHASYLDIPVLGGQVPLSFTPKSDIKYWPVIGFFCVLADCVFIERKPSRLPHARKEIEKKLQQGKIICLFPEGTTNDGNVVKPFKSGFLSIAEREDDKPPLTLQPATLVYTHANGQVLQPPQRADVAWYGDASFLPHFWRVLGLKSLDVEITFHPAVTIEAFDSRKALGQHCEQVIGHTLHERIYEGKV